VSEGPRGRSGGRVPPLGAARCGAVHRPRPLSVAPKEACAPAFQAWGEGGEPRKIRGFSEFWSSGTKGALDWPITR
jgi:hypothetical protein